MKAKRLVSMLGIGLAIAAVPGLYVAAAWGLGLLSAPQVHWWHYGLGLLVMAVFFLMLMIMGESRIEKGLHLVMTLALYAGLWSVVEGDWEPVVLTVALGIPCAGALQAAITFLPDLPPFDNL